MSYCNKITVRFLTVNKDELIKESDLYFFDSLSAYLRFLIENREIILEAFKNERRTVE